MEQLIQAFGIDARLIVVQIINFVLLLGLLSYFLYKPLLRMLEEREAKITQGVRDAESAAAAKADAEAEKQRIVTDAHHEAEAVAARAKTYADEQTAEIVRDAEDKAASIVHQAGEKGEDIKAQAHKESEAEIAKLAVLAAEKILTEKRSS